MAALIPKNSFHIAKRQTICATGAAIQVCHNSGSPRIIKNPSTAGMKRGTGGRSSFNGVVCTVFGNSGFVGRYVCNRLGKIGSQLILPYRGEPYHVQRLKLVGDLGQVLFQPFDIDDEDSIRKCIKYSNVVINLVGRDWETKNYTFDHVHVEGARTLARLCKEAGVDRLIHMSCLNASPHPEPIFVKNGSQFLKSKWQGEIAVREEFPEATIIRPSDIYGQEDRFLRYYAHTWRSNFRNIPLWEKGEKTEKQPVHVGDVAAGVTAAVLDPTTAGKTYQFVGPQRFLLSELVDWFHRVMRKDVLSYGYRRYDMRYDPFFQMRITLNEIVSPSNPLGFLHWEGIEKEHTSDRVVKGIPTLEDLGVNPIEMESRVPWELRPFRAHAYYMEELGEFEPAKPPKTIPVP